MFELSDLDSKSRVMLMFSGGFDSTLVSLLLKESGFLHKALTWEYPSRPPKEAQAAQRIGKQLPLADHVFSPIPLASAPNPRLSSRLEGWIPYKNIVMIAAGAHMAYVHGCNVLAAGIRQADGDDFLDARENYLRRINEILEIPGLAPQRPVSLFLPIIRTAIQITSLIKKFQPYQDLLAQTWSCWRHGEEPCGNCGSCKDRKKFREIMGDKQ